VRILYVAAGIAAPAAHGGATHVLEVASGLAARGHEVHVVNMNGADQRRDETVGAAHFHRLSFAKSAGLLYYPTVSRLARQLQPDIIMERYYNLAGAGILAAQRQHIPSILEINAPIVDPPASRKSKLDRIFGHPLRRWAARQCRLATRIVTPLASTVPSPLLPQRGKICQLPWGANVAQFDRQRVLTEQSAELTALRNKLGLREGQPVAVFSGSFRHWHGVDQFATAAPQLAASLPDAAFLLLGSGPLLDEVRQIGAGLGARFITPGAVAYDEVPLYLALASLGVAPFNPAAHEALSLFGFYWSPLKIFEYMAMSLPTVTIDIQPLNEIVRPGVEGLLYPAGNIAALRDALASLLSDPAGSAAMGQSARQRVVADYSWQEHCRALEEIMTGIRQLARSKSCLTSHRVMFATKSHPQLCRASLLLMRASSRTTSKWSKSLAAGSGNLIAAKGTRRQRRSRRARIRWAWTQRCINSALRLT
jgi:starch synthase